MYIDLFTRAIVFITALSHLQLSNIISDRDYEDYKDTSFFCYSFIKQGYDERNSDK
jgi:hypothetical protein